MITRTRKTDPGFQAHHILAMAHAPDVHEMTIFDDSSCTQRIAVVPGTFDVPQIYDVLRAMGRPESVYWARGMTRGLKGWCSGIATIRPSPSSAEVQRSNDNRTERTATDPRAATPPDAPWMQIVGSILTRIEERDTALDKRRMELEEMAARTVKDLARLRDDLGQSKVDHFQQWIEAQRKADLAMQTERERLRLEFEERRSKLEEQARARDLELMRATVSTQGPPGPTGLSDEIWATRLDLIKQQHALEVERIRGEFESQIRSVREEMERKQQGIPIPKDEEFYRWYWERKAKEDMPDKTVIETILEQVQPLIDIATEHPELLQGILGRITMKPGSPSAGSLPLVSQAEPGRTELVTPRLVSLDEEPERLL